jgi:hypothetical protein
MSGIDQLDGQQEHEKKADRRLPMPTISMFYGILVLMYFHDDKKHSVPHIHAEYGEHHVFRIDPLK